MKRTLMLVPVLALAACEDPLPPVACGGGGTIETVIDHAVSETFCFEDPNLDMLTYTATSSNPGVATAVLSGSSVAVTGIDEGTAQVSVTATDPGGLTGSVNWAVSVKYLFEGSVTECSGRTSGGYTDVEMEGWLLANLGVSGVIVRGLVGGRRVGEDVIGNMRKGERESFRITGRITRPSEGSACTLQVGHGGISGSNQVAQPWMIIESGNATLVP